MISLDDFQPLKTNLISSTTEVLQKDISVTKSMPFWLKRSQYKLRSVRAQVSADSQVYQDYKHIYISLPNISC